MLGDFGCACFFGRIGGNGALTGGGRSLRFWDIAILLGDQGHSPCVAGTYPHIIACDDLSSLFRTPSLSGSAAFI